MSNPQSALSPAPAPSFRLSLDAWAVLIAFTLAAFVRFGVLKHIPW
jgi:hypothetical protein